MERGPDLGHNSLHSEGKYDPVFVRWKLQILVDLRSESSVPVIESCVRAMTMKDEAAILSAREGNEDAFRRLYDIHRERIYRIAYRYTRSVHDAEDIMQETFIKAFRRMGDFRIQGETSFDSWLTSICINCAIDQLRKRQRQKMDATITLENMITDPGASQDSPDFAAEQEETLRLIRGATEMLSPTQRIAFDLRYNDHLSIAEISRLMQCSESAVKTHLTRSVQKLKSWLEPLWRSG